jgi:Domain of unknown function (DUF6458)
MGIGASVFLLAVGLILGLAVDVDVSGINLQVIGWILVAVGAIGLVMTAFVWGPRNRRDDVVEERHVTEERR